MGENEHIVLADILKEMEAGPPELPEDTFEAALQGVNHPQHQAVASDSPPIYDEPIILIM